MPYHHPTIWYQSTAAIRLCKAMFSLKAIHDDLLTVEEPLIRNAVHAIGTVKVQWAMSIRREDDDTPDRSWMISGGAAVELRAVLAGLRQQWMEQELIRAGYRKDLLIYETRDDVTAAFVRKVVHNTPAVEAALDAYVEQRAAA